eukprot:SAG11_NODE_7130_length_1189_cov_1.170642_1_plen_27_part_10
MQERGQVRILRRHQQLLQGFAMLEASI